MTADEAVLLRDGALLFTEPAFRADQHTQASYGPCCRQRVRGASQ